MERTETEVEMMYARVAFFEDHDPGQIDELIRRLDERSRRHAELLPESKAFLTLVDREAGKSIGITFFDTLEGLEASESALANFPRTYPDSLKGRRVGLEVYEVGVADRPGAIVAS
jgi:hypothetical protein